MQSAASKILIAEDDRKIAELVARGLEDAGYEASHASGGEEALELAARRKFDGAIVDLMMPGMDGLTLIKLLREREPAFPILILSAMSTVDDRVRGLREGGDDYLVKPFAFAELLARMDALLRRTQAYAQATEYLIGDLRMDLLSGRVTRAGRSIDLQPREYQLLKFLMENGGRLVSRDMIMRQVWNYNFDPGTNVVEARMCRLRDKIDKDFSVKLIHTIRGAGYVIKAG